MYTLAILTGLLSYCILVLGLTASLTRENIIRVTLFFIIIIIPFFIRTTKRLNKTKIKNITKLLKKDRLGLLLLFLILVTAFINFIGVLGPELSFDALWYHLTLPKIYLANQAITHIPGGLLYYSEFPRLTEMLYTIALSITDERGAKFIHFSFGLLSMLIIYKLTKKHVSYKFALAASLSFYSTLVVGWLSTTAYVDLGRTFFEVLTFASFLSWWKSQNNKDIILAGISLGLAFSVKSLSLGSLPIYLALICMKFIKSKRKKSITTAAIIFITLSIVTALPWYLLAFLNTGHPFYPIGAGILGKSEGLTTFSIPGFLTDGWNLILNPDDPISPVFLIFLPVLLYGWKRLKREYLPIPAFCLLSYFVWYLTPHTGGGRFFLPYVPMLSILLAITIEKLESRMLKNIYFIIVIFITILHLGVRSVSNAKYLPLVFKKETKENFLAKNLPFSTNVFVDTDDYFKKTIKENDLVLIFGTHNLFYVNFPFVHESWAKGDEKITYVLTQNSSLPAKYNSLSRIYKNPVTGVELYKNDRR